MNQLIYNGKTYDDVIDGGDNLMSASAYIGDSLPAVSLPVDTLTAEVYDSDLEPRVLATSGLPIAAGGKLLVSRRSDIRLDQAAQYGDVGEYRHGGALIGKFRLEEATRIGRYRYRLSFISAIGLLLTETHYGGLYAGESVAEVVRDVIGGIVPYTLDESLGAVPVYGLLRKRSRRDNLRDLLFAVGGQIRKDTAGEITIGPMPEKEAYEITEDELYMGGSVTGGKPATGIDVTEHSFLALPGDTVVSLYEGAAYAEELVTPKGKTVTGVLVDFAEPMHDLAIENAEILERGVNYAVISGSPAAVLTGRQYTHTERIISRRWNTGGTPNVVTSRACELVNLLNSELVADRLQAYYGSGKTVEAEIVVTGQKPGDAVTFTDPFGDPTEGYIADMELTMSAILKAKANLVSGFLPVGSGNYYSNVMTVTESQTVTIPAEAKNKALLVLIGGGDGGAVGNAGEKGSEPSRSSYGEGGAGGLPGAPGKGGKIAVFTIPVKAGQTFAAKIGSGGKGQTLTAPAEKGGDTTFGTYSSKNGYSAGVGYANLFTGEVYGIFGEEGIAGGHGGGSQGDGPTVEYLGETYTPGSDGEAYKSGSYIGAGGKGGGAAAGSNGGDGTDGSRDSVTPIYNGGDGGRGATPVKAQDGTIRGQGGQGGHGGGGGGAGGPAKGQSSSYEWPGTPGDGGSGGEGGDGASGIAILFY